MIDYKTQTKRSTKFNRDVININLFCNHFEFGLVTSKYWGDFEEREMPLVEMEIFGQQYQIPLDKFKEIAKEVFKVYKN